MNNPEQKSGKRLQQLLQSDFIGCAEGSEDLSTDYKKRLSESLEEKFALNEYQNLFFPRKRKRPLG